ncbi:hypothetical protein L6452_40306 [Arctium lappa]|uniref:Uncharacterized protein n=1 Tax=Arctium lappa TaxID=4217 RepID=A0ACB8XL17_ARCLA|nr:hypothetical protein L6452_40306 [Arctium lappa]
MSSAAMKTSDQEQFQIGGQINQPWPKQQSVDNPPLGSTHDYYEYGGQPPSVGDMRPLVISQPSGSRDLMSVDGQPPSLNDVGGRGESQNGGSFTGGGNQMFDPQAFVGMSLVGKNFKKMYPMAYEK